MVAVLIGESCSTVSANSFLYIVRFLTFMPQPSIMTLAATSLCNFSRLCRIATHGHTAAEVINQRANADSSLKGVTSFRGDHPTLRDVKIAKNYPSEDELKIRDNLVSGYFDFAEIQAITRQPMYMSDYVQQLDTILSSAGEALLNGPGSVSHQKAMEKGVKPNIRCMKYTESVKFAA